MSFRQSTYLNDTSPMKKDFPPHALWPNHTHSGHRIHWGRMETVNCFPGNTMTVQTICSRNETLSARLGRGHAHPSVDLIAAVGPGRRARSSLIRGTAMWAAVLAGRRALGRLGPVRVGIRLARRLWGVDVVFRGMIVLKGDVSGVLFHFLIPILSLGSENTRILTNCSIRCICHCYYGDCSFDRGVVYCDLLDQTAGYYFHFYSLLFPVSLFP